MSALEQIAANSFRNFHAKGFDYLCLHRSPALTLKAYFFDEVAASNPELVMPHDHRYGFTTTVLNGSLAEKRWVPWEGRPFPGAKVFQEFSYRTPLNGGDGFTWERETVLVDGASIAYQRGETYMTPRDQVHTLAAVEPGTVIVLTQFADALPIGEPTRAFSRDSREPPSLSGLYDRMSEDHARRRIAQLCGLGWPSHPLLVAPDQNGGA